MAFTSSDLTALDRAIADGRGARSITFNDQTVSFSSISEMLALRATMIREINADDVPAYRLAVTRKVT